MGQNTGFKLSTGADLGAGLVDKSYLIDRYPDLADTFKQAGLWKWGYNTFGALGDGTTTNRSSPVQTVAGGTNWKQVDGEYHTVAIKTDGTLWMWGYNNNGQLGDGTTTNRSSPVQTVSATNNWKQVACSASSTAAIKTDGTLWLWGDNSYGQLGDNTIIKKSSPVQTISGGTNWKQVSCGGYVTSAIKTDGTLWLWGQNTLGQLGDNTLTNKSSPVQTVAGGTNWSQAACSPSSTAAIKTDGTLWMWGKNDYGQLGNNTIVDRSSPIQTISGGTNWKQVSTGTSTSAIKTDGTLWTWGYNAYGQLGDNTIIKKSSPVQTIAGGTNWKQVSSRNSVAAIKTDGTLWTWGQGANGQLGDNTITQKSSPVQTIAGGSNWKQVVSNVSVVAIRDDSSDKWGDPT